MVTKQHCFGSSIIVPVLLGVLVDVSSGMMSIEVIPPYPVIGGSVTLSVTGITGTIQTITWYKGPITGREYQILTYIPGDNPIIPGPLFIRDRMTPFPNGSLQISNLNISDEGDYRVMIQSDRQSDTNVHLKIYASTLCQTSGSGLGGGEIAGIVIGTVFEAPSSLVYENEHVSEQNYERTLPGTQEKVSQASHYEELTFEDKSIYSIMKPAAGKY